MSVRASAMYSEHTSGVPNAATENVAPLFTQADIIKSEANP